MAYRYSIEREFKVYDAHGDCIRVGPDADGLDLVELRQLSYVPNPTGLGPGHENITARLIMPRDQAMVVAEAILDYCKNEANFTS